MKTTKRMMSSVTAAGLLALVAPLVAVSTAGCGGSRATSNVSRMAAVRISVDWPERLTSRLIPRASESIKVTVTNSAGFVKSVVLVRPSTSLVIGDLPPGELQIQASAFPSADPQEDVPQAIASQLVNVKANQTFEVSMTMTSTIDHVAIHTDLSTLRRGADTTISAAALDSTNRIVLTNPATWVWSTSDSSILSFSDLAKSGFVHAGANGTASIRARETESGKEADVAVTVVSPLPQLTMVAPDTERLVGQESVIAWSSTDAISIVSSNFGALSTNGNVTVTPKSTTTYSLKVANELSESVEKSITVRVATVTVNVAPSVGNVDIGKSLQLVSSVTGAVDTGVQWSVIDAGGGSVSASGLYTAPLTQGTYRVKATSSADLSKSATCVVRVRAAGGSIIIN